MYLSKVSIVNYRNFPNSKFLLSKGINTIIGENGSGKTNFFRAVRLLLDEDMRRSATKLEENDFFRGLNDWRGHWIIISLEFSEVSQDEAIQALFLHGAGNLDNDGNTVDRATYNLIFRPNATVRAELSQLAPGDTSALQILRDNISTDDYETVITGKSSADFNSVNFYPTFVGDFDTITFPSELNPPEIGARVPPILSMAKEISFTYVQALRDVVSEFHNTRTNPLLNLLKLKSSELNQTEFDPIVAKVDALNTAIETLSDVEEVRKDISLTASDAMGDSFSPKSLSIKSNLSDEAEQIFQSLKLFIAESEDGHEGAIHEMSLGGANLIYLTLKLLEFKYLIKNRPIANFLLIEEPEAHIHTHIQKTLFERIDYPNTQVIYSTHSSHISEASNIKNVNVIGRVEGVYEVFHPISGLDATQIVRVQRYLDAIRSNLLFAKSVILVEGDAEEILIPTLVKKIFGVSLDELGISLVNIRSTGFENVALLFHDERIRKKCSILTDLDASYINTIEIIGEPEPIAKAKRKAMRSAAKGAAREKILNAFCNSNSWISTFYAPHTFEVDLVSAGNKDIFVNSLADIYTDQNTINNSTAELNSADISKYGTRAITMANHAGKGWFAITLSNHVTHNTMIPTYILDAVIFAHSSFEENILFKMIAYRVARISSDLQLKTNHAKNTLEMPPVWYEEWATHLSEQNILLSDITESLQSYQDGTSTLDNAKKAIRTNFPVDGVSELLDRL